MVIPGETLFFKFISFIIRSTHVGLQKLSLLKYYYFGENLGIYMQKQWNSSSIIISALISEYLPSKMHFVQN